jgi:hypothetical protein
MDVLAGVSSDSGSSGAGAAFAIIYLLVVIVFAVATIAGMWKSFQKAGIEGWWAIIPFANWYHLTKMSGKEMWWFILLFIPCINIVAIIVISMAVAERFGKTAAYGIGLWLIPVVFWPMLGFGDAEYQGEPGFAS